MTIRTVTVSGVTAVYFDPNSTNPYFYASEKYCWVKNNSNAAMYVSLNETCTAGADGTALIAAGEVGMIQLSPANTIYISGSGSAEIRTTDVAVCPFKVQGKGGESETYIPFGQVLTYTSNGIKDVVQTLNNDGSIDFSATEYSAGHEYIEFTLSGLTAFRNYKAEFTFNFLTGCHFYTEDNPGTYWRTTAVVLPGYEVYSEFDNVQIMNVDRSNDLERVINGNQKMTMYFYALNVPMKLRFQLSGLSDNTENPISITSLKLYQIRE